MVTQHARAMLSNDRLGLFHWSGAFLHTKSRFEHLPNAQRCCEDTACTHRNSHMYEQIHTASNSDVNKQRCAEQRKLLNISSDTHTFFVYSTDSSNISLSDTTTQWFHFPAWNMFLVCNRSLRWMTAVPWTPTLSQCHNLFLSTVFTWMSSLILGAWIYLICT